MNKKLYNDYERNKNIYFQLIKNENKIIMSDYFDSVNPLTSISEISKKNKELKNYIEAFIQEQVKLNENYFYFFAYGTLMSNESNHEILLDMKAEFIDNVETINKYPIYYDKMFPYVKNHIGFGNNIKGELYKINIKYKQSLSEFEGVPELYYPFYINVINQNKQVYKNSLIYMES